jgi:8-amino-7-oxononanoate synthase
MAALDHLAAQLAELDAGHLRRRLRQVCGAQGAVVELDGRRVVNFASNNYLGLANHPALGKAAALAATMGTGSGASRLIVGNTAEHDALELETAAFHRAEAALVFNSGYQANLGVVTALAGPDDLIVSDELNHASLIDACRLSRARIAVYRHGDLAQASALLDGPAARRFLISESVFSMDGDVADVAGLADVARRQEAALILYEAHAVGALGPDGRGMAALAGVTPDVLVGTYGKAFGSFGAYVVGALHLREWLISRARSFIFTTGLPPAVVAASRAAVALARTAGGEELRKALVTRIERVAAALGGAGLLAPSAGTTPIFPVFIGPERETMSAAENLLDRGFYAQGIRPPTVPRGTSRLRVSVMAPHTDDQLNALVAALTDLRASSSSPHSVSSMP